MKTEMIINYKSEEGIGIHIEKTSRFYGLLKEIVDAGGFWTGGQKYFIPWHKVINVEKRDAKS